MPDANCAARVVGGGSRSSDHRAGGLGRRGRDARGRPDRRAGPGPAHHRSARLAVGGDLSDHLQRLGEPPVPGHRRQDRALAGHGLQGVPRWKMVYVHPPKGRDIHRRSAAHRGGGQVELRPDRRSELQGRGALVALTGYTGSKVIDEHTVQVNFKQAYAPFLSYAAGSTLAMVSPKTTPTQGDAVNQKPVGSGPYVVAEYAQKDHITIARNADYNRKAPWSDHQGPPYLDRIVFKIIPEPGTRVATIESGETQMINALNAPAAVLGRLERNKSLRVERVPYPGAPRIWMLNVTAPPTDDLRVRQALNFGVNRAAFVESVYKGLGKPACAPLTQAMLADPSLCAVYPYNP